MSRKVAIVTGANKGIGFAIVRALCNQYDGDVFLTSRNVERGEAAVKLLKEEGLHPKFHQLDIENEGSIIKLRDFIKKEYGGVDVLVNNAGFAYKQASTESFAVQTKVTLAINYYATVNITKLFMPIMKNNGRVVILSSVATTMILERMSPERAAQFKDKSLTEERLNELLDEFIASADRGTVKEDGFYQNSYGISKLAVSAITKILARQVNTNDRHGILLNCCHPGFVKTDMAGPNAPKTIDEGARSSLYLCLLPAGETQPQGEHIHEDNTVVNWQDWAQNNA